MKMAIIKNIKFFGLLLFATITTIAVFMMKYSYAAQNNTGTVYTRDELSEMINELNKGDDWIQIAKYDNEISANGTLEIMPNMPSGQQSSNNIFTVENDGVVLTQSGFYHLFLTVGASNLCPNSFRGTIGVNYDTSYISVAIPCSDKYNFQTLSTNYIYNLPAGAKISIYMLSTVEQTALYYLGIVKLK